MTQEKNYDICPKKEPQIECLRARKSRRKTAKWEARNSPEKSSEMKIKKQAITHQKTAQKNPEIRAKIQVKKQPKIRVELWQKSRTNYGKN